MRTDKVKQAIVELLHRHPCQPLAVAELAEQLDLRGKEKKHLQKWLNELVKEGDIVCLRRDRYGIGTDADLIPGRLSVARSGNGYVATGTGEEVFVPQADLGTALPGDRVLVRLAEGPSLPGRDDRHGRVIRVLERARRDIVGTLRSTERFLHVVPMDPVYKRDFYVPAAAGARPGDRVVIRFVGWENKHVSPEAEIIEVIGPSDDPSGDTIAIMRHYGFHATFPEPVMREAEEASARMETPGRREDLRDRLIITIDPDRARDFDDALSLETAGDGTRVLGIHIADVSHFVRRGQPLDVEARERGNSVYLPDRVIPMLPEQLSNGICSLKPDEDRLAFSVFLTVDAQGAVTGRRFAKTLMRSRRRLTYGEAWASIQAHTESREKGAGSRKTMDDVARLLVELNRLAQQFRRRRFARFALDLDMPETEVVIGADGLIKEFRPVENDPSHQLVEECMVAANEAVAQELSDRGVPYISRLHEPPKEERIEELAAQLVLMGFEPGDLKPRRNLAQFLKSIADNPLAHPARVAVLRSMNRACYSGTDTGHFGLAKSFYAHFTSPIRRYPDLTVHRQLEALLAGPRGRPYTPGDLNAVATHSTTTEWNADEAERSLIEMMKLRYLQRELALARPTEYDAVVITVTNFGMFVEVESLQIQGLVHISALSDGFVRYSRKSEHLRAGKTVYRAGQRVRVFVTGVDFDKRRVDFGLAG